MAQVLSLNTGTRQAVEGHPATAIDKQPVPVIEVRDPGSKRAGLGSGVVGDEIGSRKHHGGTDQAVYAYAREDLDWWADQLGRPLRDGIFGENLTVVGVDCTNARIGERWTLGSAVLEVRGPRIPCRTFARHMAEPRWVARFTAAGRTGAYLAVLSPGEIRVGDAIEVERPDHAVTVLHYFRALMGDRELRATVLDAGVLSPEAADELRSFRA